MRKFSKDQLQTFYKVEKYEITVLKALKHKLVKSDIWGWPRLQADHTISNDLYDKQRGCNLQLKQADGTN